MRIYRALILLFCLVFHSVAYAETRHDGNWWIHLDENSHYMYLIGFFEGLEKGKNFIGYHAMLKGDSGTGDKIDSWYDAEASIFENMTRQQMVDGLSAFYSDFRNRTILVHFGIMLVAVQASGMPEDKMNKLIEDARRNANNF